MELVSSNLEQFLENRSNGDSPPLSLPVAVDIMLQISRAMEYLHSQEIMHLDLKASNVLFELSSVPESRESGYGRAKLCDFGTASPRLFSFRASDPKGTSYWRAPEVFPRSYDDVSAETNNTEKYTNKADVYSFGMTCYQILTGKQPFPGLRDREIYTKIVKGERPTLEPSVCPFILTNYIQQCWDTDPDRRPCFEAVSNFLRKLKLCILKSAFDWKDALFPDPNFGFVDSDNESIFFLKLRKWEDATLVEMHSRLDEMLFIWRFLSLEMRRGIAIDIASFFTRIHGNSAKGFSYFKLKSCTTYLDWNLKPIFSGSASGKPPHLGGIKKKQAKGVENFKNIQGFGEILVELSTGCTWKDMQFSIDSILRQINCPQPEFVDRQLMEEMEKKGKRQLWEVVRWCNLGLCCLSESSSQQPNIHTALQLLKKGYPIDLPVGIENAQREMMALLNMTPDDQSKLVVVVYGFRGLGKTTLSNSVVGMLNLDSYNYARVQLDEDKCKNNLKKMQELILKDAFPSFPSRAAINLRDCQDGRDRLTKALSYVENKPVFLHIDNALRSEDLKELLPKDLSGLPKRSRILLTTRMLDATDVFLNSGLTRVHYAVKPLDDDHALKILCKDASNSERIKDDIERILPICGGIPLTLKIVGGHLSKMGYNALEKGDHLKEENLSGRIIDFVYNELKDSTKDAFLDICYFFNGWLRRQVEYIVEAQEVRFLEEAALVTPFLDDKDMEGIYAGEERLRVHDIVRAKGLRISASTRFTDVQSFLEAAQNERKLNRIKGLWFRDSDYAYKLNEKHLTSISHSLRILCLGVNMRTSAHSPMKFKELRYFDGLDVVFMDTNALRMLRWYRGPCIFRIHFMRMPKRLSFMNLYGSERSRMGFEGLLVDELVMYDYHESAAELLNSVEELSLRNDIHVDELHRLSSLKFLSFWEIHELKEFPEQVCELSSLIKLQIIKWSRLKRLPQSFGQLKGLTHLNISYCDELEEVPSSFGELTALEHLTLSYCIKLKGLLPGGLESLNYLNVIGSPNLSVELYRSKPHLKIVGLHS